MTESEVMTPTASSSSSLDSLGLLVLRLAVGATLLQAGLLKAVDFSTVVGFMESGGWRMPTLAATMVISAELAGGVGLLLGLLTPLAACAAIGAMIDAWAANVSASAFWSEPFNVPFLAAFAATALIFTGAGAYSVDAKLYGRARWPGLVGITLFLVAVAAAVATWVLLNGSNPIHLEKPPS